MNISEVLEFSSISELDSVVSRLTDLSSKTAREVLTSEMRLLAVALSFNTRPLGSESESGAILKKKIDSRIRFIYPSVGEIVNLLKNKEERLGKAFSAMIRKHRYSEAAKMLNNIFPSKYSVGEFDGGTLHRNQKFSEKIIYRLVVINYPRVNSYSRDKQKLAGYAMGGFAAAARQLGGTRGIPGFASRQPSPGSGSVTESGGELSVTMTNGVKYIRQALDPHGEARALEFRKRSVEAVIQAIMDRKLKSISPHIK